jgi:hypothetical protein
LNSIRIRHLAKQGVKFLVCANLLKHLEIPTDELAPGVEIVPAGVSELVKKQSDGWAYIRP